MITVGVLCEGQTEETMVRDFLAPELFNAGIILVPTILLTGTTAGGASGRGGVSKWSKIEKDLRNRLSSTPHWAAVTMLLDYYGLPPDSPGMADRPNGSAIRGSSPISCFMRLRHGFSRRPSSWRTGTTMPRWAASSKGRSMQRGVPKA
ncbi:hypothetical protein M2271_007191 [Streptomyces sp. LBL]|uniref:DUF4276 family protein n=1 Tax=Streptomyces sp. LBL TaxID=2940562 RepID=UPI00247CF9FC|nr:hypothetical protein [Streptomyces sp. LBL]